MQKQNTPSLPQADQIRINFVKNLCSRVQEALEDIQEVFDKVMNPIPDTSPLGKQEGIGLFLYIRKKQSALKEQYPQFTEDEILAILLSQWQKMDQTEKWPYCLNTNQKKQKQTKKQKKMHKMLEKLVATPPSTQKGGSLDEEEGSSQSLSFGTKTKDKNFAIEQQEEEDSIPKKKKSPSSQVFASDTIIFQQQQMEEGDPQIKRATPSFKKLQFDVVHSYEQQNEKQDCLEQSKDQKQRVNEHAQNANLMEVEQLAQQKDQFSAKPNDQMASSQIAQDNSEIPAIQKPTLSSAFPSQQQVNKQPPPPQVQPQISLCQNPSQVPPKDCTLLTDSNQIQSTQQCRACLGTEEKADHGSSDQIRNMINDPVLTQQPVKQSSRDEPAQQEKLLLPITQHHENKQVSQNGEQEIVTKFGVAQLCEIQPIQSKIEYKQHNSDPFYDQKDQECQGIYAEIPKQKNADILEDQQCNFTSQQEECKIEGAKKQSANVNEESINQDKKIMKKEVEQDESCTQQQEQFEFE